MSRFRDTLPLHVFIRKRQVLDLYRKSLRAAKRANPSHVREVLLSEVKREYRNGASINDAMTIKTLIVQGKRNLDTLQGMSAEAPADSWLSTQDEEDVRGRVGTKWPWN